jgi:hypothetical protein
VARLRLVNGPPDAALDPIQEIISVRDSLERLQTNPLLAPPCESAVKTVARMLERQIPSPPPRNGRVP